MNSYQNKKRKRNLVKKAGKKLYFRLCYGKWEVPVEFKTLQEIMFEEMLIFGNQPSIEDCVDAATRQGKISLSDGIILKRRMSGKSWGYRLK